jgi:hypothetical protein
VAFDTDVDHVQITKTLYITYLLKTFKLVVLILNISFFLGIFFLIFVELGSHISEKHWGLDVEHHFWNKYEMEQRSEYERTVLAMYYSFTTLSTVGFGDYNPRSDSERMLIAFILPFGVAIFSYIMGNFLDILKQFNDFNADLEEQDAL